MLNDHGLEVTIKSEHGYWEAMYGISLNKLQDPNNMPRVAEKLAHAKAGSHRKFLRQIQVWLLIKAPMYWWAEFDTYKIGVTRNSSSTMHRPTEHSLRLCMSPLLLPSVYAEYEKVLTLYGEGIINIEQLKANMPAGVLLTSLVTLNYEALRTMVLDRSLHRLQSWRFFCQQVLGEVQHPELLPKWEDCYEGDSNT